MKDSKIQDLADAPAAKAENEYVSLNPLLENYWGSPLAEIPEALWVEALRAEVKKVCERWDEDDFYPRNANDSDSNGTNLSMLKYTAVVAL